MTSPSARHHTVRVFAFTRLVAAGVVVGHSKVVAHLVCNGCRYGPQGSVAILEEQAKYKSKILNDRREHSTLGSMIPLTSNTLKLEIHP